MSKRRAMILQVARETGAYWRMSGEARDYLREEAPGLYRTLEDLATITKEVPVAPAQRHVCVEEVSERQARVCDSQERTRTGEASRRNPEEDGEPGPVASASS